MLTRLVESILIAREVKHLVFEALHTEDLAFTPGQFVSIQRQFGEKTITRAYSIASPPGGNRFALCLNKVQDGLMSPWLFALEPGETVEMRPPLGYFTWREPVHDSILVATGTGVAPFRSMLMSLLPQWPAALITLVLGVRYEETLLYRDEFVDMQRAYPFFRFEPVLSRPADTWMGRTGHVQPHVLELVGERRDFNIYICGLAHGGGHAGATQGCRI